MIIRGFELAVPSKRPQFPQNQNGFLHLKNSSAIIAAFSSGVTLIYFRKFDSVVCPVSLIIAIVGNFLLYIFVAKLLLAVCIPIN